MTVSLEKILEQLPPAERARVAERTRAIIAEEKTLRELRRARSLTQQHLAKRLGIKQDSVSRIEQRSDLLLSTLRDYVAAMGGQLELMARFPGVPPVALRGVGDLQLGSTRRAKGRRAKRTA